jgi:Zn-dependent M16 (insulinase) family peptidase
LEEHVEQSKSRSGDLEKQLVELSLAKAQTEHLINQRNNELHNEIDNLKQQLEQKKNLLDELMSSSGEWQLKYNELEEKLRAEIQSNAVYQLTPQRTNAEQKAFVVVAAAFQPPHGPVHSTLFFSMHSVHGNDDDNAVALVLAVIFRAGAEAPPPMPALAPQVHGNDDDNAVARALWL